jgi:hypothetical protein
VIARAEGRRGQRVTRAWAARAPRQPIATRRFRSWYTVGFGIVRKMPRGRTPSDPLEELTTMTKHVAKNKWRRTIAVTAVGCLAIVNNGCAPKDDSLAETQSALGSAGLVISQVYGGGGNSGATYKNDFIEIFNRGSAAVSVSGWSVQYASATGSSWSVTTLSGTVQPGHHYLVAEAAGSGGTTSLPTPDATGSISMSATSAKVALVKTTTALTCSTGCLPNANIVDFVGYGSSADSFEGSGPTPTLGNTTSALRASAGCTDTDNNAADFTAGSVTPRNSASPTTSCGGGGSGGGRGGGSGGGGSGGGGSGGGGSGGGGSGGGIVLPSPTLAPVTLSSLSFGVVGDTRPPNSQTTGYPASVKSIINGVFTGFQAQHVPFAVASGDYAYSSTSAGSAVPQYNDYMAARANFTGTFLPTMGNHECNGFTDSNCPSGSYTGMMQDYLNKIVTPSTGQSSPYFSALYEASDGSWTAKVIFIAANAWNTAQSTWLQSTLAVNTTYTFTVRHEPANANTAPGVTPSENMMSSSFSAGHLTLSLTGHTHLIQLPGGTQPYGDPYGSTLAYEIISGNGGAPLDAGSAYGYMVATRRSSDGAIVVQAYQSADASANPIVPNVADPSFRFAVNANGSSNANTQLP